MAEFQIPKRQNHLIWTGIGKFEFQEVDVPTPKEGEVLIKVAASVIDPVDIAQIGGHMSHFGFGKGPGPHLLGFEGTGTVVAAKGAEAEKYIGKRVAGMSLRSGFYGQYHILSVGQFAVLEDHISWTEGAVFYDQPGTAYMLYTVAQRNGAKAAVNTGANSVLGRCAIRLFKKNGLPLINIVRRAEKVEELKKWGAEYVLNSSDADFEQQYKDLTQKLGVNTVFDCIGPDSVSRLVKWSPFGTTVYTYGSISTYYSENTKPPTFDLGVEDLMSGNKGIRGLVNPVHYSTMKKEEIDAIYKEINSEFTTTFKIDILDKFELKDYEKAWKKHHDNKSKGIDGKVVILVPQ